MHHERVSSNYPWLPHNVDPVNNPTPDEYKDMVLQPLGSAAEERYKNYIQGCVDFYNNNTIMKFFNKGQRCIDNEKDRIEMTLRQPKSVYNYTELGFTKIRAPDKVFNLLKDFWEKNRGKEKPERWFAGNIYTNHWSAPTYMLSVEDKTLEGGGHELKQHIWNAARDTIEEWTGHKQAECSLYGIREYRTGAMLAPHVDRLPLVSSAIINVAQDVDEPWPLEVIGHDGKAYNVTMLPGDLVLYESHSVIHGKSVALPPDSYAPRSYTYNLHGPFRPKGRQFPLKGRFMVRMLFAEFPKCHCCS
jgi:prolyl 4-hydroxylase